VPDLIAVTGSFLDRVPETTRQLLLKDARMVWISASDAIFRTSEPHLGIVLEGTARSYILAPTGRQLTVRYVRRGSMVGSWASPRPGDLLIEHQALSDCSILEFNVPTLASLLRTEQAFAFVFLGYLSERLQITYETLAATAFGTVRQQIARHLLELAEVDLEDRRLVARITQQGLADGLGTTREVVARAMRKLRLDGFVRTHARQIEIIDAERLRDVAGRWPSAMRSRRTEASSS
jgi:CRP/FNR family transcriptional regulator